MRETLDDLLGVARDACRTGWDRRHEYLAAVNERCASGGRRARALLGHPRVRKVLERCDRSGRIAQSMRSLRASVEAWDARTKRWAAAGAGAAAVLWIGVLAVALSQLFGRESGSGATAAGRAMNALPAAPATVAFIPEPDPDPAASARAGVDPKVGARLSLTDGAAVVIPAGTVEQPAPAQIARLRNRPAPAGVGGVLGAAYEVMLSSPDGKALQPRVPVEISLPVSPGRLPADARRAALARWDDELGEWRPVPSNVDAANGRVSAQVLHLSTVGVVETTYFTPGPAQVTLREVPGPQAPTPVGQYPKPVPRGAAAECVVNCFIPPNASVTGVRVSGGDADVTVNPGILFDDGTGKFAPGQGAARVVPGPNGKMQVRFAMRVAGDAARGVRELELTGSRTIHVQPIVVVPPPVVIVDIDGMRQDLFYQALSAPPANCPTLRVLMGTPIPGTRQAGPIDWLEFENGLAVLEATTIYPTVTIVGHAAIFTGADLRDFRFGGNQFFDRTIPEKFGFSGYDLWDTSRQALGEYIVAGEPLANKRVRAVPGIQTVYEAAASRYGGMSSLVFNNMYPGDCRQSAENSGLSFADSALYKPVGTVRMVDRRMIEKAAYRMRGYERAPSHYQNTLGIVTLYFCGLDHCGHDGTDLATLVERHRTYLADTIDPGLGSFMSSLSEVMLKNTTFLFTADHGQTDLEAQKPAGVADDVRCFQRPRTQPKINKLADLLYERGYVPDGALRCLFGGYPGEITISPADATAVVGVNGGMANLYLRRPKDPRGLVEPRRGIEQADELQRARDAFEGWGRPPTWDQVLSVATTLREWSEAGWEPSAPWPSPPEPPEYRNSIELILVRNAEGAGAGDDAAYRACPYEVFVGSGQTMPLFDWLRGPDGKQFRRRNGWAEDERDAEFLADRIVRLNGPMSGDLVVLPRYPDFYFEPAPLHGEHGGISRGDFEIPFVLARAGGGEKTRARFKEVLEQSIHLDPAHVVGPKKNRPANTDVKATVLKLLEPIPEDQPPAGEMAIRLYLGARLAGGAAAPDDERGIGDEVAIEEGHTVRDVFTGYMETENLQLRGYVNVPGTQVGAEGAPVVVTWMGKQWHTRTRAPGRRGIDEPGWFEIELPLRPGGDTLAVSATHRGRQISRRVGVRYEPPAQKAAAWEQEYAANFVTPAKLRQKLEEAEKQLEEDLRHAGDNPEMIDVVTHRRIHAALIVIPEYISGSLAAAARAGHVDKGLELWSAARDGAQAVFNSDLLDALTNARSLEEARDAARGTSVIPQARTMLIHLASLYWQAGDLDGLYAAQQTYHKFMLVAFEKGWIDPLVRQGADPSFQMAHNRALAGDFPAAVRHFEEYRQRMIAAYRKRGENVDASAGTSGANLPTWYPSERELEAILGPGGR